MMLVSSTEVSSNHVVIGGGKAEAFRLSDTADFFTLLSDTLYSDKERAVVREVMNNAWDEHVAMGKEDVPVEVTVTEIELTIRDFGPGIAPENMVDIYCVYGSSTKLLKKNQTGGFGLGSKAPFAYAEHFTVISEHAGVRTVYAISRGSAETGNKPDIRVITRTETEGSGLTVTVPLKDISGENKKFHDLVCAIAMQGGMRVNLTSSISEPEIKAIEPSEVITKGRQLGWALVDSNDPLLSYSFGSFVLVSCGGVIYPIDTDDQAISSAVSDLLGLFGRYNGHKVILFAKPDTVSFTPSRESLSFDGKTTQTVLGMAARMKRQIIAEGPRILRVVVHDLLRDKNLADVSTVMTDIRTNNAPKYHQISEDVIPPCSLARAALISVMACCHPTVRPSFETLAKLVFEKFPELRRYMRRMRDKGFRTLVGHHSERLLIRLARDTGLGNKLTIYDPKVGQRIGIRRRRNVVPVDRVVVTPSVAAFEKFLGSLTAGQIKGAIAVFLAPKISQQHLERIRSVCFDDFALTELGDVVKPPAKPKSTKAKGPKKFYAAASLQSQGRNSNGFPIYCLGVEDTNIEIPKFYIQMTMRKDRFNCPSDLVLSLKKLARDFYQGTVVTFSKSETAEAEKLGARPLKDVILEDLNKAIGLEEIADLMQVRECAGHQGDDLYYLSKYHTEMVAKILGMKVKVRKKNRHLFELARQYFFKCDHRTDYEIRKVVSQIRGVANKSPNKSMEFEKLKETVPGFSLIDFSRVEDNDFDPLIIVNFLKSRARRASAKAKGA